MRSALVIVAFMCIGVASNAQETLPDPDGQPADMGKPVKVFILMGQSNMLGFGAVEPDGKNGTLVNATKSKGLYPHLIDDAGAWTVRKDVRNVRVMVSGAGAWSLHKNDWLTAADTKKIGPELQFGYIMGHILDEPVLILKSCIGNRSLGWDLLPPGSVRYEFDGFTYAGFGDSPAKWAIGTTPNPIGWTAGIQYVGDTTAAKDVLSDLGTYYPGASKYEIAGFVFWQGDKDRYDAGHASRYEANLVSLIKALRTDFDAPNAPFVCATLGQTEKGATGNDGLILEAQLAVAGDSGNYPEFEGNVATVYAHPLSMGGSSNGHYSGNAETYMNVGNGLGWAMAELLQDTTPQPSVTVNSFTADPTILNKGASATLNWSTSNATGVSIDNGVGNVAENGSHAVTPLVTTTYTLIAEGTDGPVNASATVEVVSDPEDSVTIDSFTADPAIISKGASATLTWSTSNATGVSIDNGVGRVAENGSHAVTPLVTTTYTLIAEGTDGPLNASATVEVVSDPEDSVTIDSFTADPTIISKGASATLTWSTSNATGVSIDNGVGSVAENGSHAVTPLVTTTYTLIAEGTDGPLNASATVEVVSDPEDNEQIVVHGFCGHGKPSCESLVGLVLTFVVLRRTRRKQT